MNKDQPEVIPLSRFLIMLMLMPQKNFLKMTGAFFRYDSHGILVASISMRRRPATRPPRHCSCCHLSMLHFGLERSMKETSPVSFPMMSVNQLVKVAFPSIGIMCI
ncbi:unnamed protein product [Cylindrotheca closterium]|uniref:Uncharacterized protein n=1 Tax=Cylindrotheca closterium TaxID=2856 RepID=A0AAD2CTD3_9STRA|nr:unnamed protein product [Cylindrotheca closterium]